MAQVATLGIVKSWSATCGLHKAEGLRCNKTFNMGTEFTDEQARRRIKEWCLRGAIIPNEHGGRKTHMDIKPRTFLDAQVRSEADLNAAAHALLV